MNGLPPSAYERQALQSIRRTIAEAALQGAGMRGGSEMSLSAITARRRFG
jgi:hypothetical protein